MHDRELKEDLHRQRRGARAAVLWKLEGLSEYDVRRPLVPTGTNLLGLVKHLATVEWGHFGAAFGDPLDEHLPWVTEDAEADTEASADMWVEPSETRSAIVGLYERVAVRSDEVIERFPLDAVGQVPWWPPEISRVTLHAILAHTVAEAQRTRATPTSCASWSTARPGTVRRDRCSRPATASGGAPGSSAWSARPGRADESVDVRIPGVEGAPRRSE